jgi:hypothetical protein
MIVHDLVGFFLNFGEKPQRYAARTRFRSTSNPAPDILLAQSLPIRLFLLG